MSTALTILVTIGALSGVCCLALLVAILVSPGRPERNTIGWAQRNRSKSTESIEETVRKFGAAMRKAAQR